tara:strand:- start:20 stop:400 length:381 start_codon:yes stop_codon:yes gene_type:complete
MIRVILHFYVKLVLFSFCIALVHYTFQFFDLFTLSKIDFIRIHVFNFLTASFLFPVLVYGDVYLADKAGFIYLALSLFKMLLAMIFMAIVILPNTIPMESFALQFLVVYGAYLVFDLLLTVRKLKE